MVMVYQHTHIAEIYFIPSGRLSLDVSENGRSRDRSLVYKAMGVYMFVCVHVCVFVFMYVCTCVLSNKLTHC